MASEEKIYPKGFRTFAPREGAPDFVLGDLLITLTGENGFYEFLKNNPDLLSEYQGEQQIKLNIVKTRDGRVNFTVNTWKPQGQQAQQPSRKQEEVVSPPAQEKEYKDDLPF